MEIGFEIYVFVICISSYTHFYFRKRAVCSGWAPVVPVLVAQQLTPKRSGSLQLFTFMQYVHVHVHLMHEFTKFTSYSW